MTRKRKSSGKGRGKRKTGGRSKKSKATRSPPVFARAKVTTASPAIFKRVTAKETGPADPIGHRRRLVYKNLRARDVPPPVAQRIAYEMDPGKAYVVAIYGFGSSDPNETHTYGDPVVLQAKYIGSGARLWSRLIGYATVAPIEDVDIKEIVVKVDAGLIIDRPFWETSNKAMFGRESVRTVAGPRVYGHGHLTEWVDRKKLGAPKKSGGGMTAAERRKDRKRKKDAIRRKLAVEQRIDALKAKKTPEAILEADRLLERSKRRRKVL